MATRFRARDIDNSAERLLVTGLIVSDKVIDALAPLLSRELMTARYASYLLDWCLAYYKRYRKAPKRHIQSIFEHYRRGGLDEEAADIIESLLADLSAEFIRSGEFNEDYAIEQGEQYIKTRRAQLLSDEVAALLSKGQIQDAEERIAGYRIPKRITATAEDVFSDSFWNKAEEEQPETLFRFPGELGELVGPVQRDSFISFLAPEKTGKTWMLLHSALTAFRQRNNVIFYSVGDMTEKQMRNRIQHMLTHRDPKRQRESVMYPMLDCIHNQQDSCPLDEDVDPICRRRKEGTVTGDYDDYPDHICCTKCQKDKQNSKHFRGCSWCVPVNPADYEKSLPDARAAITKRAGKAQFKLHCSPPQTMSASAIAAHLDMLEEQEGFIPDVIIIDYADLLAPEPDSLKFEYRHQINATWMALRALSQKRNCLVLTATQAKLEARKRAQTSQWDTSEDKRKLAHVTAMLALSQTPVEKRQGIIRISNIAMRDSDFDVDKNVVILQCLALGKVYITSYLKKPVDERRRRNE